METFRRSARAAGNTGKDEGTLSRNGGTLGVAWESKIIFILIVRFGKVQTSYFNQIITNKKRSYEKTYFRKLFIIRWCY